MLRRLVITLLNILFPPLAVLLLCGPNEDLLWNCLLFLLAVIPSHVHAFYISLTYFNRKRRVRKGVYPGPPKAGIYCERVNCGGASRREVERLRVEKELGKRNSNSTEIMWDEKEEKRRSRKIVNSKIEGWDDGYTYTHTPLTHGSGPGSLSESSRSSSAWSRDHDHNSNHRRSGVRRSRYSTNGGGYYVNEADPGTDRRASRRA